MWILIQTNKDKTRFKYLCSKSYSDIITYINTFSKVKKYSDYYFTSSDELFFEIRLGEELKTRGD